MQYIKQKLRRKLIEQDIAQTVNAHIPHLLRKGVRYGGMALLALGLVNFPTTSTYAQSSTIFVYHEDVGATVSLDAVSVDKDNDGDLDVIVSTWNGQPTKVYENDGTGHFVDTGQSLGTYRSYAVASGDFNNDGCADLVVGDDGTHDTVWLNECGANAGTFTLAQDWHGMLTNADINTGTYDLAVGDLDNDGDLDIVSCNYSNSYSRPWWNDGNGNFSPGNRLSNSYCQSVALGDLDGDGTLDIYLANLTLQANEVWLNNDDQTFRLHDTMGNANSKGVDLADVDLDGDLDAFVVNGQSATSGATINKLWENDGAGNFTDSGEDLGTAGGNKVVFEDVTGDGAPDAVVAGSPIQVLVNDGSGSFTEVQTFSSHANGVALGDFSGDQRIDAFVARIQGQPTGVPDEVWLNAFTPDTTVVIDPDSPDICIGDDVNVTISVQNATGLYGAEFECMLDNTNMSFVSGMFTDTLFDPVNRFELPWALDQDLYHGGISNQRPASSINGSGSVANIGLVANTHGSVTLMCTPLLSDIDGFVLPSISESVTMSICGNGTLVGVVTYQGRLEHDGIDVIATGRETVSTQTDVVGNFTLIVHEGNGYMIEADAPRYLPACESNIDMTPDQIVTLPDAQLQGGDVNDDVETDLVINIGDASLVASNFGETVTTGDARADINNDNIINIQDVSILQGNYGLSGCQPWE